MKKETDHPHHKQSYILTCSLAEKMQGLRNIGIEVPPTNASLYGEIQGELSSMIEERIPGVNVVRVEMSELAAQILTKARKEIDKNALIASTCLEIASPTRGATIEVNRIIDSEGSIIGLGPRPGGHPQIMSQVAAITKMADGRPIALVEDGAFTGKTLARILDCFKESKAPVKVVALGFAFPRALDELGSRVNGTIYTVECMSDENLLDWVPDHDFLPFVPNCGRTFGFLVGKNAFPLHTHDGRAYATPYVYPYGKPCQWASIPGDGARSFSYRCVELARHMFGEIAKMNGGSLTVGDLTEGHSRVSIPYRLGQVDFPNIASSDVSVVLMDSMRAIQDW